MTDLIDVSNLSFTLATLFITATIVLAFSIHLYSTKKLTNSFLYYGRVKHCRLKGGAVHSFNYPICFSYIDLNEISTIGWSYWPVFKLNSQWLSFSSLENCNHLKDLPSRSELANSFDLPQRVKQFVDNATKSSNDIQSIHILTHLTYFGYCFNPISVYFINYETKSSGTTGKEMIIAEVSNTPWIEQHSYLLDERVPDTTIIRNHDNETFEATWRKEFHVSPFMEMDYQYKFVFSKPGQQIAVQSQLVKLKSNEVWFTASFVLERMPFTPWNILYILVFYPFHTRIIQAWIHYEAVKLWWKGVPTFGHPDGTDLHFGLGITDKHLIKWFSRASAAYESISKSIRNI